ncbi:MAG: leucine-rich repeat domain-containing protein [Crocinitomicaceae bacterium]
MMPKLEITELDQLGYYSTYEKLFPGFAQYFRNVEIDSQVIINFSSTDEDSQPSKAQFCAYEFFIENSDQILKKLMEYLKKEEEYFLEFYGTYVEISYENTNHLGKTSISTHKNGFPAVDDMKDIINYISIDTINIVDSEEDGISYVGFDGGCTWDDEHGFGCVFHKLELLDVGDWDTGQYFGESRRKDDEYLLKNIFFNLHKQEPLEERTKRLAKLSENIQVKKIKEHEELFDWLVSQKMIYGFRNSPVNLQITEKVVLLNEIETLKFLGNEIGAIPDFIYLLQNLSSLSLNSCSLESIPEQIFELKLLKSLSINNNRINSIPDNIGLLTNIETLNLHGNKLQSIPASISQLCCLREFDLSSNQIFALPTGISELSALEKISLKLNSFSVFPKAILAVEKLTSLDLMWNKISEIPEIINKLTNIEYIDLRYNKLSTLPDSLLNQIPSLKYLNIVGNQFSIKELERIKRVISPNLITDIDMEISFTKDMLKRKLIQEQRDEVNRQEKIRELNLEDTNKKTSEVSPAPNQIPKNKNKKWWEFWK